jgi:hypothetical protein
MSDLHSTAEKFLREYLEQSGSKAEPVLSAQPLSPSAHQVAVSRAVATDFIKQLRKTRQAEADATNAERYELEDPQQVVLSRRTARSVSYFYGFKRELPVFTHDKALAMVIDAADRDGLCRSLEIHGIETFALPAPNAKRGSL